MGDNLNEGDPDEKPVHTVILSAFYIGKYEITNGEFTGFLSDEFENKDIIINGNVVLDMSGNELFTVNASEKRKLISC